MPKSLKVFWGGEFLPKNAGSPAAAGPAEPALLPVSGPARQRSNSLASYALTSEKGCRFQESAGKNGKIDAFLTARGPFLRPN